MNSMLDAASAAAAPAADNPPAREPCRNCGAPLLGGHCHACGQPVRFPVLLGFAIVASAAIGLVAM